MEGLDEEGATTTDVVTQQELSARSKPTAPDLARSSLVLVAWMASAVLFNGILWITGARSSSLSQAVERGAARAESRGVGEVGDDLVHKAVRTQHETLPFWTTLTLLGDFLAEPIALALRAVLAATCFSALAALMGRPVRYDLALGSCSAAQGFWVLGMAVRTALVVILRQPEVETSAALLLAPGTYTAKTLLTLRQADLFALLGWATLARGAWRRGQVRLPVAITVCISLALIEADIRIAVGLLTGSAMRLELVPDWL